jgi:hypothetical protein
MSIERLKPSEIEALIEEPGKHADGGGLYLQVAQPGQASWVYRYTIDRRERWKSLGPASLYTLKEVRDNASASSSRVSGLRMRIGFPLLMLSGRFSHWSTLKTVAPPRCIAHATSCRSPQP